MVDTMRRFNFAIAAALWTALVPNGALAHSHEAPGEHVKEFAQHIEDYEKEVDELVARLEDLAERYRADKDMSTEMNDLIETWEEIEYHEALERKAALLYPPIWQALIPLREAVNSGAAPEEVMKLAKQTSFALHQGMGGLKIKAQIIGNGGMAKHEEKEAVEDSSTISRIETLLDQSARAYAKGNKEKSKALIHEAYMNHFEGIEGTLIEHDPDLVSRLEENFNATLPNLIDTGASMEAVREEIERIQSALQNAGDYLEKAEREKPKVF